MTPDQKKTFKLSRSGNAILLITMAIMMVLAAYFTTNTYYSQTEIYRDKELAKLLAIVNTLVTQVDGNLLRQLDLDYPNTDDITSNTQDARYLELQILLSKAKMSNELETTLYTMVYDSSKSKFCFLINSEDRPFWKHDYKDFPEELTKNYHDGGVIFPYRDLNGYWLSAFAPIKDSEGKTVAVLQADERFDDFKTKVEDQVYRNIFVSLVVILLLSSLLLINVRSLLKKEEALKLKSMELDALRNELIANVSHDLRTPLSSIQGYLETIEMKKGELEAEQLMKYVGVSLRSAEKLRKLIDELFELSKLESKDRKPALEKVNLEELLVNNLNAFKPAANAKNIRLEIKIEKALPFVLVDAELIDRVVNNLVNNAVKFTPENGQVVLFAKQADNGKKVKIGVLDTGPGLEGENSELIFRRMYTGSKKTGGSGLGLAIARSIVQIHGSELIVKSEFGKGAEFSFLLTAV